MLFGSSSGFGRITHGLGTHATRKNLASRFIHYRKDLLAEYKNTATTNIILGAILLFSIFTSIIGVKGVWQSIFQ